MKKVLIVLGVASLTLAGCGYNDNVDADDVTPEVVASDSPEASDLDANADKDDAEGTMDKQDGATDTDDAAAMAGKAIAALSTPEGSLTHFLEGLAAKDAKKICEAIGPLGAKSVMGTAATCEEGVNAPQTGLIALLDNGELAMISSILPDLKTHVTGDPSTGAVSVELDQLNKIVNLKKTGDNWYVDPHGLMMDESQGK